MDDDDAEVQEFLSAALGLVANAPMTLPKLTKALIAGEFLEDYEEFDEGTLADIVADLLTETDDIWVTSMDVVASTAMLLRDVVFTHRVSASELERGMLDTTPDLEIVDFGTVADLRLPDGREVILDFSDGAEGADELGSYIGPDGWLDAFKTGDVVAVRRHGDVIELTAVTEPGDGAAEVTALKKAFDELYSDGYGVELTDVIMDTLAHDPTLFRAPVRPLGDMLEAVGLELKRDWVGPAGETWTIPGATAASTNEFRRRLLWGFNPCCERAFQIVHSAWGLLLDGVGEDLKPAAATLQRSLAHGSVAAAFADDLLGAAGKGIDLLDQFAQQLADLGGDAVGPALFLRARNAEEDGRVLDAEALYRESRQHDLSSPFTVTALARMASERGDANGAIALLRGGGMPPEHPLLHFLTHDIPNYGNVGRNEPCPCGSGRKFKQCCINNPKIPIEKRSKWLLSKVVRMTDDGAGRAVSLALVDVGVEAAGWDVFEELFNEPFFDDLAVFEGGLLGVYLDRRGVLLPDDERALAESWLQTQRRLWEVTAVDPGWSMTLRDAKTGDTVTITEQLGSTAENVGDYLLARVAAVGDQHQAISDTLRVPPKHHDAVLALIDGTPTAEDWAAWYGSTFNVAELREFLEELS